MRYALASMKAPSYRWTETDPFGQPIHCGEAEWQHVLIQHGEMAPYETAVRATLRRPDAIYRDPKGTAEATNPDATVRAYFAQGYGHGPYRGKFVKVSVKWLPEGTGNARVGYLQTAFFLRYPERRLELEWSRWQQ